MSRTRTCSPTLGISLLAAFAVLASSPPAVGADQPPSQKQAETPQAVRKESGTLVVTVEAPSSCEKTGDGHVVVPGIEVAAGRFEKKTGLDGRAKFTDLFPTTYEVRAKPTDATGWVTAWVGPTPTAHVIPGQITFLTVRVCRRCTAGGNSLPGVPPASYPVCR
ncbi:MAG TPA: hypothetical protein PLB01_08760 [Thermoanaerobaculia bacterium]|nr:hypothetical protein [Thermoanaerobaculia bacterium]